MTSKGQDQVYFENFSSPPPFLCSKIEEILSQLIITNARISLAYCYTHLSHSKGTCYINQNCELSFTRFSPSILWILKSQKACNIPEMLFEILLHLQYLKNMEYDRKTSDWGKLLAVSVKPMLNAATTRLYSIECFTSDRLFH